MTNSKGKRFIRTTFVGRKNERSFEFENETADVYVIILVD